MGGIGSGRSKWKTIDDTVECPKTITYDVLQRYREGKITKGAAVARPGSVELEWTSCTFGGMRPWFRCPEEGCGRRVRFLYELRRTSQLKCRQCCKLRYRSQALSKVERLRSRIRKSSRRLGVAGCWVIDLHTDVPDKPRGMHQSTYNRLLQAAVSKELAIATTWQTRTRPVAERVHKAWQETAPRRQGQRT